MFFEKLLKKQPFPPGISEEVLKMAPILMPHQKSHPESGINFDATTEKRRHFGVKNNNLSKVVNY